MFVVETDALCKICDSQHRYVTKGCTLNVYTDYVTASMIAKVVEGYVRPIKEIPPGVSYTLCVQKNGKPDERYPRTLSSV